MLDRKHFLSVQNIWSVIVVSILIGTIVIMDTNEDASSQISTDNSNGSDYPLTFGIPRISIFSGNSKGATQFDLWQYEVQCLKKHYDELIVLQAIRRSLRGEASKALLCLGHEASVDDIVLKLNSIYGDVQRKETFIRI